MADQLLAHPAAGGKQIEHAFRHADSADALGQDVGIDRRFRRGLCHDCAASRQRGGDLVAKQYQRRVPGRDCRNHADQFLHHMHAPTIGAHTRFDECVGGNQIGVVVE